MSLQSLSAHRTHAALPAMIAALVTVLVASDDAEACGGCFHQPVTDPSQATVVTAHRMAFSISQAQTVLWDQVQYAGSPKDFAWVLPIKPGAYLQASNASWFEALDAATATRIFAPNLNCGGGDLGDDVASSPGCSFGCGAEAAATDAAFGAAGASGAAATPPPPVTVVHEGTVGPYETVTLHANVPNALPSWLTSHGYAIDPTVQPIIDAYSSEGFDFIALRLQPLSTVREMTPVRVVSPGASPTLPLRMVSAGTGANVDLTLFVIGEGRWEAKNFPNDLVDPTTVTWDFNASSSDYQTQRQTVLAKNNGTTWITAYAQSGAMLSSAVTAPANSNASSTLLAPDGTQATSIADLYVATGTAEGASTPGNCSAALDSYGLVSASVVVDVCAAGTGDAGGGSGTGGSGGGGAGGSTGTGAGGGAACGVAGFDQIDSRALACGPLDDVAVALTGMHPANVWVTRLEAQLPHAALANDFVIQASTAQTAVDNWVYAGQAKNQSTGCTVLAASAAGGNGTLAPASRANRRPPSHRRRNDAAALFAAFTALAFAAVRRMRRTPVSGDSAGTGPVLAG